MRAFKISLKQTWNNDDKFLEYFKSKGFYLDDLCLEPVNQYKKNNKIEYEKRKQIHLQYLESLAERIKSYNPKKILIVYPNLDMKKAAICAIERTGLSFKIHYTRFSEIEVFNISNLL